jgi:hypothetical protein
MLFCTMRIKTVINRMRWWELNRNHEENVKSSLLSNSFRKEFLM